MSLRSLSFDVNFNGNTSGIKAMNDSTNKLKESLNGVSKSTDNVKSQAMKLAAEYRRAGMDSSSALKKAWSEIERSAKGGAAGAGSAMTGLAGKVMGVVSAVGLLVAANKVIGLADSYSQTSSRINLMNDGLQTNKELQDKMYAAALDTHTAYGLTADAVSKLGITTGNAFSSSSEIVDFVGQLNKQFKIGGTSIEGQSAATLQLTQAMASGVLRGDELNSIYENAPTLIKSMADYMGVPVEKMRGLAEQGLITTDVIKNGVLGATEKTNAQFETMGTTFGQVWTDFKTRATQAFQPAIEKLNELSNSQGFKTFMDNAISGLAVLGPALVGFVSGIIDFFNNPVVQGFGSGIATVFQQIAPLIGPLVPALTAMAITIGVVTAAQWLLNAALTANPIGIVVMAIAAVVGALVYFYQTNESVRNSMNEIWAGIQGIVGAGLAVIGGLWNTYGAQITAVASAVWGGISFTIETIMALISGIITTVLAVITGDWAGAWEGMKGIVQTVIDWFAGIGQAMWDIGANIVNGIIEGIKSKVTGAVDAVKGIASNMADAFKSFWGINSPATLGIQFGGYIPEGIAIGVKDGVVKTDNAMKNLSNSTGNNLETKNAASVGSNNQNITLNPTINITVNGGADTTAAAIGSLEQALNEFMENYVKKLGFRNPPQYV